MVQAEPTLTAKVAFLHQPDSYPGRPLIVEVIETHLSWVFLTPTRVYKLKKPARYDFLDFSTLAARRHNCEEEVRLNRHLAPAVYLGVVALRQAPDASLTLTGKGVDVDYLVVMQRLLDAKNLQTQLKQGTVRPAEVDKAANRLATFYLSAAAEGPLDLLYLRDELTQQLEELTALLPTVSHLSTALWEGLAGWIKRHRELLAQRRIIEVHGDLRPQHVYLGPAPVFIDRLEFNRGLRLLDAVEELAFLSLECDRLGGAWVGQRFLEIYLTRSGDVFPTGLVGFYKARRALLWALLSVRHLTRGGGFEWQARARAYLEQGWAVLSASG